MACPEPVIRTKETLEGIDEGILDVKLDSFSSIQNVKRFASNQGLYFSEKKIGKTTIISIVKGYECEIESSQAKNNDKSFWVLIIGSITTAILASTCCMAPLLFLLFSISASSVSFLNVFAPYHYYFLLITVVVISYLWYHYVTVIRRRLVCEGFICRYYLLYLSIGTIIVSILLSYQYWVVYLIGE